MGQYSKKHSMEAWRKRLRVELADALQEQARREALGKGKSSVVGIDRDRQLDIIAEGWKSSGEASASEAGKQAEDIAQWTVAACISAVFALVALMALLDQAGGPL